MKKHMVIILALFCAVATAGETQQETGNSAVSRKIQMYQKLYPLILRADMFANGQRIKIATYLDACGKKGLANAVREGIDRDAVKLMDQSKIFDSQEFKDGSVTPEDVVIIAAMAEASYIGEVGRQP